MKNLTMAVDYYDLIMAQKTLFDESSIDRMLGAFAERGVDTVQWRVSVLGKLLYHTQLGDRFTDAPFGAADNPGFAAIHQPIYDKSRAIMAKMDPMEVASRLCRKHGIRLFAWLTIYDDAGFHPMTWSALVRQHPECCWKAWDRDQYFHGVTSYVYPEVVTHRLAQIRELLHYDVDGIYLCNRSHSRPPGFLDAYLDFLKTHSATEWRQTETARGLPAAMAACKGHYGFDPPAVEAFRAATGRDPHPDDPEWWRHRRGYLTAFLRQARGLTDAKGAALGLGVDADIEIYPEGFFDWAGYLSDKLVDEIQIGATGEPCGRAQMRKRAPELFLDAGRKHYFRCFKRGQDVDRLIEAFDASGNGEFLDQFDGLTLFEAYHFLLDPALWHFAQELRRRMG